MPIIRLYNPKKRRQTKRAARRHTKRRNRNSLGEGVLTFMANPKREKKRNVTANPRHRRRSYRNRAPAPVAANRRKRHSRRRKNPALAATYRRHRRRSNPIGSIFPDAKGLAFDALYLAGGGITARGIPQAILPQYNVGWVGYGLNLLTTAFSAGLIGRFRGAAASKPWLLGGFAFTMSRIIEDYMGIKLLQFAQWSPTAPFTLSGDTSFGMRGAYGPYNFPLPSTSYPPRALPAVNESNAVPANAGMSWDRSFN